MLEINFRNQNFNLNMYVSVFFLIVFIYGSIGTTHGSSGQNSSYIEIPFFENNEMPLFAKFDVSKVNRNIKAYIDNLLTDLKVAERLDALERITKISDNTQGTIAFSAYMSESKADQSKSLITGAKVVFDKVLTNENNVYNTNNGIFRAPKTGLFAFTWTICVDSRFDDSGYGYGEYGTQLMYGSSVIGVLHADAEKNADDDCSTGFVVYNVQSTAIDIYLKVIYAHQGKILSKDNHTRSTFTGWKLY